MVGCEEEKTTEKDEKPTETTGGVGRAASGTEAQRARLPGASEMWQVVVREDGGLHLGHPAWSHAETGRRES
ncbi:hypothetical protein GCM10010324_40970 [Streptomyces hiroshimensis]|uniref:Uncharacterized protein n=1 Tax=Streptomyces hiroshimensis TaxID=66424 RepID=A0ABQ2YPZ0_9ACTN|nr:hypothetical protein GCM10010324_40970 [Streptomyces hiroshimensis]